MQFLGLSGAARSHVPDQNRQEVSGSGRGAREIHIRNGARRHADDIAIGDVVRGRNARADHALILRAHRLLQQAHRGCHRLAWGHFGPLLRSYLHRPFERAFSAHHRTRVVETHRRAVAISALECHKHSAKSAERANHRRLMLSSPERNDGLLRHYGPQLELQSSPASITDENPASTAESRRTVLNCISH